MNLSELKAKLIDYTEYNVLLNDLSAKISNTIKEIIEENKKNVSAVFEIDGGIKILKDGEIIHSTSIDKTSHLKLVKYIIEQYANVSKDCGDFFTIDFAIETDKTIKLNFTINHNPDLSKIPILKEEFCNCEACQKIKLNIN